MSKKVTILYFKALDLKLGKKISPVMAIIHPTNRCNHRCPGCEYANILGKASIENICDVIDQLTELGIVSVLFTGGGEPTLHPSFANALLRAKENNLSIGIFSNGTTLNGPLCDIIADNADFIRISIDAATKETFQGVRGVPGKNLESVRKGIVSLLSKRDDKPEVGLKFLIRKTNLHEIIPFGEFGKSLGVDSIQFKPIRQSEVDLDEGETEAAISMIDELKARYPGFVQGGIKPIKATVPCWITPLRVLIDAEGKVFLCNYFNHRRDSHCIGSLGQKRLTDIWFSKRHIEALKNIRPEECCLFDCRFHSLNAELQELVKQRSFDFV